jgi:UDP-glucose 4-epimerase
MNTIAITGSAGLIGSHLCHRFLKSHKIIGIDNLVGGYASNMPDNNNFIYYNEDILNSFAISNIFKKHKPELIIHCAALAHEGLSVFSPSTITNNIYSGTVSVASAGIATKVKTFINTSSMARYGNIATPFKESDLPNPIDPYGLAKLHAEQQLNLLSDIHGIRVFHLVPHNVSGPHQCYSDPFRNVMSIFANRIINDKNIYIYGDGEQKRSFSHIDDCVDAFISLYNKKDELANKSVFNIGPSHGTEITINELAYSVYKHFNREPDIKRIAARPREVLDAWVSTEKAEQLLDYKTHKTTEDVIADTVAWIRRSSNRQFNYHLPLEIITEKTPKTWTDKLFND